MLPKYDPKKSEVGATAAASEVDPLENLISDKKLEKHEREAYKHSFLVKYLETAEDEERFSKTERHKDISPKKKEAVKEEPIAMVG